MKRAKKLMPTLLLLAFIIFAVGIGIHSLHRDAYAQVTVSCDIYKWDENLDKDWLDDADVQFRIEISPDVWGNWQDANLVDGAHYFYSFADIDYRWQVRLEAGGDYSGADPLGDVQTWTVAQCTNFEWRVVDG